MGLTVTATDDKALVSRHRELLAGFAEADRLDILARISKKFASCGSAELVSDVLESSSLEGLKFIQDEMAGADLRDLARRIASRGRRHGPDKETPTP